MTRKPIVFDDDARRQRRARRFNRLLRVALLAIMVAAIAVATWHFRNVWQQEEALAIKRLETFAEVRARAIRRFLSSHRQETRLWANQESFKRVAARFIEIWRRMTPEERESMRFRHIAEKKRLTPARRLVRMSAAIADYEELHALAYGNLRNFMIHHGYYDIFFFTPEGDLAFTVVKEDDYGLNFVKGPHAASSLGRAFREAMLIYQEGWVVFTDFAPYAPSNNDPAAFFAAPMFDEHGGRIGVYAIQIPVDKLDEALRFATGLGRTGQTYAVGPDLLMRNNARLDREPTLLKRKVDTDFVRRALAGERVVARAVNARGRETVVVAIPMDFDELRWAVVTEMELAEMREPYRPYLWLYVATILFILFMAGLQYWLLRRT